MPLIGESHGEDSTDPVTVHPVPPSSPRGHWEPSQPAATFRPQRMTQKPDSCLMSRTVDCQRPLVARTLSRWSARDGTCSAVFGRGLGNGGSWGVRDDRRRSPTAPRRAGAAMAGGCRRSAVDRQPGHIRAAEQSSGCRGESFRCGECCRCGQCRCRGERHGQGRRLPGFRQHGLLHHRQRRHRGAAQPTDRRRHRDGLRRRRRHGRNGHQWLHRDLHDQRQRREVQLPAYPVLRLGPHGLPAGLRRADPDTRELTGRERHVGAVHRARHARKPRTSTSAWSSPTR